MGKKRTKSGREGAERAGVRTVSFVSLGCPKNLVDSEKMLGLLAEGGIQPLSYSGDASFDGADAVVVNTCGFLEASKDESLGVIKEAIAAKEAGSVKRVIVAGCLVQRHRAKMLEWAPGIDAMIGVFDRDRIVEAVRGPERSGGVGDEVRLGEAGHQEGPKYWIAGNALQAAKARGRDTIGLTVNGKDGKGIGYFEDDGARLRLTPRHYAYLRISEGCNQNCAFCTIPSIRGKMRSKPLERIVGEARELVRDGAFELNLIGQDTTSYGDDIRSTTLPGGTPLRGVKSLSHASERRTTTETAHASERRATTDMPSMLRAVSEAVRSEGGSGWVRLMYAYPSNFSDAMIDSFAALCAEGCVVPYIDMPLQHGSDRILAAMRRNVTTAQQGRVIRRLRERVPGMAVRTTFISGFPGEMEDDHKRLLEFVEEMGFEALGVFEYSKEEGTPAGTMEEDESLAVPAEVKARRRGEIMALQQKIVFARNEKMVGMKVDVLIDEGTRSAGRATAGVGKGGKLYRGRTKAQAPMIDSVTFVQSREALSPGELVRCEVVGADGYDLVARPVEEDGRVRLKVVK